MRRQPPETRSQGTRLGPRDDSRGTKKRSRLRRLTLEGLEQRALLSTLPTPFAQNQRTASANNGGANSNTNLSSPTIIIDPVDPSKLVQVSTDRNTTNGTVFQTLVTYSNDGGLSWNSYGDLGRSFDPSKTDGSRLQDYAQGVGFDRSGHFYVATLETNSLTVGSSAGYVRVDKFDFNSSTPGLTNSSYAYQWNQSVTGLGRQAQILSVSIAVDANAPNYAGQSDPFSGDVYLAWSSYTPPPSPAPNPYHGYNIAVVESPDGIVWPRNGAVGSSGVGFYGAANSINGGNSDGVAAPQLTISQGKVGQGDAGLVSVVWDDITSFRKANPPQDGIEFGTVTNLGGGQLVASAPRLITTTSVLGAQAGANFPLSSPVAPNGIGPGIAIAVDNTLGTHSAHQGRIYVTYVDRYYQVAGNPADNTDIFLAYSDDDGRTWSFTGMVNDDDATIDGHTSSDPSAKGRPQFQPAIAVDQATGTLVMSWLDARDDAAIARYADYITYSVDGGSTFAPQTYADLPIYVKNAADPSAPAVAFGPSAGNESGGNPNAETSTSFGTHQGLAVYGGVAHPAWASTALVPNGSAAVRALAPNQAVLTIETALVSIPGGPRVISGTSGSTGATSFSSFTINFDRPVSTAPFLDITSARNLIQVQYLDAVTGSISAVAIGSVTPLNASNGEATSFRVNLAQAQTGPGTYSYAVYGTRNGYSIQDLVESAATTETYVPDSSSGIAYGPPTSNPTTAANFADGAAPGNTATSTIAVANAPLVDRIDSGQAVSVSVTLTYGGDTTTNNSLTLQLTAPNGQSTTLTPNPVVAGGVTSRVFNLTTSAFAGHDQINGNWTLTDVDSDSTNKNTGTIVGWGLGIALLKPQTAGSTTSTGNVMDQNPSLDAFSNGVNLRTGRDYFANPNPVNPASNNPFAGPYDGTTAPIVIAGPHVVGTFVASTMSAIAVSGAPVGNTIAAVQVSNVNLSYATGASLSLVLTSPPDATGHTRSATLATGLSGNNVVGGTYSVPSLAGLAAINGKWTLSLVDPVNGATVGSITGWSLAITTSTSAPLSYAAPTFLGVSDPIGSAQPGKNLVLNASVSSIDVRFNVPVVFTSDQVLGMTGPSGAYAGQFTVTPDPQPGDSSNAAAGAYQTWKVTFVADNTKPAAQQQVLPQQLSGTYSLVLGSGIYQTINDPITGAPEKVFLDTNQNAGVPLLFTNSSANLPSGPTTFTAQDVSPASTKAIAPGTVTTSQIVVPPQDVSLIADFALQLNISYSNDPDLTITLTTPDNEQVVLFDGTQGDGLTPGQSEADFNGTVFQDSALTSITDAHATPPFVGQFRPRQSLLAALQNKAEAGTYTLTITDTPANPSVGTHAGTLNSWSITATPVTTTNHGLGESVADRAAASFRIFTMDPTNPLSSNTWTAIGPAAISGGGAGRVSSIAVDPSDPSGNTVYASGASGGVWKTTNFLTAGSAGPTWVLLTGLAQGNALNIGSIAVFARNNDPSKTIIVAGTGEGNTAGTGFVQGSSTVGTSAGVGFLISYDGGASWTLDDSLSNYNADGSPKPETNRTREFFGTSTYKVLIDPNPTPSGDVIIYAALGGASGGTQGVAGIYRSIDSGRNWTRVLQDNVTDLVFDPNSGTKNTINTTGNLQRLYAGIIGKGVWMSTNEGTTWAQINGTAGDPLVQNIYQGVASPVTVTNPTLLPTAGGGRIILAKPALLYNADGTPNTQLNTAYQTWLYAGVVGADGKFVGLFLTKDNGSNWTNVRLGNAEPATATAAPGADPTNDFGATTYDITGGQGNYDFALAVDPNNPNVVYMGGSSDFGPIAMMRVDVTRMADPYSLYASDQTNGGQILPNTTSPVTIRDTTKLTLSNFYPDPLSNPYTNVYRNPTNVSTTQSTVYVTDTKSFSNDGSGAWWTPFGSGLNGTGAVLAGVNDLHAIVPIVDPVTGRTRLYIGGDQGLSTGVDDGKGGSVSSFGGQPITTGLRNGNIQITQIYNGAAQPGSAAAQAANALFYAEAQDVGSDWTDPNILNNGNILWNGPGHGDGTDVITDQSFGAGGGTPNTPTLYESVWPCCNKYNVPPLFDPNEFFQVNGAGRTFGLLQTATVPPSGTLNSPPDPQWPYGPSYNFAVNPVYNQDIIFGSKVGRLFITTNQGVLWSPLAEPSVFDGSVLQALTYGAPAPGAPAGELGNYILVGTTGGHIYATFNGGGGGGGNAWQNLSAGLDGTTVQRIVPDPTRGSHDAFAITSAHVYYNADTSAANSSWTDITGDLFAQSTNPFNNTGLQTQAILQLAGLAVDWRYTIENVTGNRAAGTHPMVYVSGLGGVFRSTDVNLAQPHWTAFPGTNTVTMPDGSTVVASNGGLPTTSVVDLDLVLGNVDPSTGFPDVSTGPDILMASTYGNGAYAIRLAPVITSVTGLTQATDTGTSNTDGTTKNPAPQVAGQSEPTAYHNQVAITLMDVTDPTHPFYVGGYNPTEGINSTGDAGAFGNAANDTDAKGNFNVQANYSGLPGYTAGAYDGKRTLQVIATDVSGVQGNPITYQFTLDTQAPKAPGAPVLVASSDSSGGRNYTNAATLLLSVTPTATDLSTSTIEIFRKSTAPGSTYDLTSPVGSASLAAGSTATVQIADASAPEGTFTYAARMVDLAGNASPLGPDSAAITVDRTAPVAPASPTLTTDTSKGKNVTSVKSPSFTVATGELTPTVTQLLRGTASDGSNAVVVGANGTAASTPIAVADATSEADGTYYYFARQVDLAGNVGPLSATGTQVRILTAFPAGVGFGIPTGTPSLALLPNDDSGVKGDNITNKTQPHVYGQAPVPPATGYGYTLQFIAVGANNQQTVLATQPDPSNGQYSFLFPTVLSAGQYTVFVRAVDVANNTLDSPPLTLTIQTTPPKPVQSIALAAASNIPGNSPNATVVRMPTLVGMADPGSTVTLYYTSNGSALQSLGTAKAQVNPINGQPAGYFSIQLPKSLTDGTDVIYAFASDSAGNVNATYTPLTLHILTAAGDYTNVGRAGLSVYTPGTGSYAFAHPGTAVTTILNNFGPAGLGVAVPGDYNGDGLFDPAVYNMATGVWSVDVNSQANGQFISTIPAIVPPSATVVPAPGAFDVAGLTDPAVYDSATGKWTILHNVAVGGGSVQTIPFGVAGLSTLVPVPGDYFGAGSDQLAFYQTDTGNWLIVNTALNRAAVVPPATPFKAGDVPAPADYDGINFAGNNIIEETVFRPSTQTFYIFNPLTQKTTTVVMPRLAGQGANDVIIPVSADYTGDGKADAAIFDQTLGTFEYIDSKTGKVFTQAFLLSTSDVPPLAPEAYRIPAAAPSFLRAAIARPALAVASTPVVAAVAPATPTQAATPAVVVGATVPNGLTSTGKSSVRPPVPAPSPAPSLTVLGYGSRPNQGDATDRAIDALAGN